LTQIAIRAVEAFDLHTRHALCSALNLAGTKRKLWPNLVMKSPIVSTHTCR